ncbi:MAG: AMP phosphorylase [Candidatus Diapherotrites archaeon]|nr:AMP phosphorylase [Candidatus Diapherotrites archaeon]
MNGYAEEMSAKIFGINTGELVVLLNIADAKSLGVFPQDRLELKNKNNGKTCVAVVDTSDDTVKSGEIGVFHEAEKLLGVRNKEIIIVKAAEPIKSIDYIKKKMNGERLSYEEIFEIVKDFDENRLSEIEGSAFVSAVYINNFSIEETISMTKALIENGNKLKIGKGPVVDKHSVGGVNGRASMIIVPIVASAGLYIPKTSSRSITSAAGTADAMEVLAPVSFSLEKIKEITEKHGAIIAWGGAVDLAPADDKIIRLEHPLSLDPPGQVIASVLAKKASVGSQCVVIDLPVGKNVKIKDRQLAMKMAKDFVEVGKHIGMEVEAIITNGEEPNGLAFGPALEAKYVLEILEGKRFDNLAQKSCELAGALFELAKTCKPCQGYEKAKEILESGRALKKMQEIIKAQGGKIDSSEKVILSNMNKKIFSQEEGTISEINTKTITRIARIAGAPANMLAGVMLCKQVGDKVKKGDPLMIIYGENQRKLEFAVKAAEKDAGCIFERIILSKVI